MSGRTWRASVASTGCGGCSPQTFPRLSVLPARIASAGLERAPSAAGSEFLVLRLRCCRHRQQVHTVALLQLPDESMIYPQIFTERSYWPWRDGQGNITPDCVIPLNTSRTHALLGVGFLVCHVCAVCLVTLPIVSSHRLGDRVSPRKGLHVAIRY